MDLILVLLVSATFPVAGLGFLLWMARFEDRLPDAVRRSARRPDPPPILTIPVQRSAEASRRRNPGLSADQGLEGSRSVALPALSAGGSTNR